jgi:ribosomal protein L32
MQIGCAIIAALLVLYAILFPFFGEDSVGIALALMAIGFVGLVVWGAIKGSKGGGANQGTPLPTNYTHQQINTLPTLTPCRECGNIIARNAISCPHCGSVIAAQVCPSCGGRTIERISLDNKIGAVVVFGVLAARNALATYKCRTCGHKWR